jgi:hypothetical protein
LAAYEPALDLAAEAELSFSYPGSETIIENIDLAIKSGGVVLSGRVVLDTSPVME